MLSVMPASTMYALGKNPPNHTISEIAMTATSLFIHVGFVAGLCLAILTGLALS